MSNRRKIREPVMQALYALSVGELSLEHVLETIIKPEFRSDGFGRDFAERLFLRSVDNREQTDQIIRDHIANWEIERLAMVDRVILQMAITEILTFEDIPTKVSINEAIEIAKKYSTSRSGPFVNGILDAVVLTLQNDGILKKEGRGLVDLPARKKKTRKGDIGDVGLPQEPASFHSGQDAGSEESDIRETPDPIDAYTSQDHSGTDPSNTGKKGQKKPRIKRPPKNRKN
jgi:transcription antitermination protein NusB